MIAAGTILGPCKTIVPLGAGGMGMALLKEVMARGSGSMD